MHGAGWLDQVDSGSFTVTVQVYCLRTTLGSSGDFLLRNSAFVQSNHHRLIYEMPDFQRPPAWLKGNQPSNRTMITPQQISNGSKCGHGPDWAPLVAKTNLDPVEQSRVPKDGPQYQWSRKLGPNDRELLPSQCLPAQGTDVRVQRTDNPYHWEVPQSRSNNIST